MPLSAIEQADLRQKIADAEAVIKHLEVDINKAYAAKLDVSDQRQRLNTLKEQVALLKQHYL